MAVVGSGAAFASSVNVNGILEAGEYLGGTSHGTKTITWYNDHESTYGEPSNNLHWEISGAPADVMLNVFFEVPGEARRMIWDNACNYAPGNTIAGAGCTNLSTALQSKGLTEGEVGDVLDAYADNHHGNIEFTFDTQTGSEIFELQDSNDDPVFRVDWEVALSGEKESQIFGANYVDHASSLEWVLANGCNTTFCDAWATTASIEVKWSFTTQAMAESFLDELSRMRLHLSDEARGLPVLTNTPSSVPLPATLPLLLAGVAGFGLVSRRKRSVN